MVANWLLGEVSRIMNADNIDIIDFKKKVSPDKLVKLAILSSGEMVSSGGMVTSSTAKLVLEEMYKTGNDATDIISQRGLSQISDTTAIEEAANQVIAANVKPVADYKAGKEQALKFLVGQVMKATRGRANPQIVNELLKKRLEGE
jgi:aspartyl-tRNA(Asn)/glutamyl-tRNA(Gln) amidotransferase subunit B